MSTIQSPIHSDSLADVLERVLDKGVVIAGDVVISLVGIELLSIKVRLLICTVEKAMELGINWWEVDPALCAQAREQEALLRERETAARGLADQRGAERSVESAVPPLFDAPPVAAPVPAHAGHAPIEPSADASTPHSAEAGALSRALAEAEAERQRLEAENREVRGRLAMLERRIAALGA